MLTSGHGPGLQRVHLRAPAGALGGGAIAMIFHLFRRTPRDPSIASLYGAIVAQARVPAVYQCYGVLDSANGRFELIVLHAALLVSPLARQAGPGRLPGRAGFAHRSPA